MARKFEGVFVCIYTAAITLLLVAWAHVPA